MSQLKYIGNGAAIPGVPAKDLTKEQIRELGLKESELVDSGLYEKQTQKPKKEAVEGGK